MDFQKNSPFSPIINLNFLNAREITNEGVASFIPPSDDDLLALTKGCNVNVKLEEYFWVYVIDVQGEQIIGVVNNILYCDYLNIGDVIQFNKCNILKVNLTKFARKQKKRHQRLSRLTRSNIKFN